MNLHRPNGVELEIVRRPVYTNDDIRYMTFHYGYQVQDFFLMEVFCRKYLTKLPMNEAMERGHRAFQRKKVQMLRQQAIQARMAAKKAYEDAQNSKALLTASGEFYKPVYHHGLNRMVSNAHEFRRLNKEHGYEEVGDEYVNKDPQRPSDEAVVNADARKLVQQVAANLKRLEQKHGGKIKLRAADAMDVTPELKQRSL